MQRWEWPRSRSSGLPSETEGIPLPFCFSGIIEALGLPWAGCSLMSTGGTLRAASNGGKPETETPRSNRIPMQPCIIQIGARDTVYTLTHPSEWQEEILEDLRRGRNVRVELEKTSSTLLKSSRIRRGRVPSYVKRFFDETRNVKLPGTGVMSTRKPKPTQFAKPR